MTYRVAVFEVEGGSDKWLNGRRKDTMPIVEALRAKGVEAEVLVFRPEWADRLAEYLKEGQFDAYISRVNPGNIPGGEAGYFDFLRGLSDAGLLAMPHPDDMMTFGAKDVLAKLADTDLVPDDTYAYYDFDSMKEKVPVTLSLGERVLKQNRGSTGSGIWRVTLEDERTFTPGEPLPGDAKVKATEAVDNHVEHHTLDEFIAMCEQYVVGDNGMVVDMKFMPRITEGEIRILLVGEKPVFVVHKKPADVEGAFSATLFSGATYTYDSPDSEQWQPLIKMFSEEYPTVKTRLGDFDTPLLWTADFMLDDAPEGGDAYVLGEFNCSCVGFTSHLDRGIQEDIADEVIRRLDERAKA